MKALILDNLVVQVAEEEFEVAPTLTWMEAPADCEYGWILKDDVLSAPPAEPEKTYDQRRREEYKALNQFEMTYDDEVNGTTTWKDAIAAIKAKWPKDNSGPV